MSASPRNGQADGYTGTFPPAGINNHTTLPFANPLPHTLQSMPAGFTLGVKTLSIIFNMKQQLVALDGNPDIYMFRQGMFRYIVYRLLVQKVYVAALFHIQSFFFKCG